MAPDLETVFLLSAPEHAHVSSTLVRQIADDPAERAIVESINRVAHALRMRTVAEYVSTPQMLETLRELGVDYALGSLIGEPTPID